MDLFDCSSDCLLSYPSNSYLIQNRKEVGVFWTTLGNETAVEPHTSMRKRTIDVMTINANQGWVYWFTVVDNALEFLRRTYINSLESLGSLQSFVWRDRVYMSIIWWKHTVFQATRINLIGLYDLHWTNNSRWPFQDSR